MCYLEFPRLSARDGKAGLIICLSWHRARRLGRMERYAYKVIELREKLLGGKMSGDKLEKILNENASQGWQLKTITAADVKGRIGPGGVEGLLVTFERRVA